MSELVSKMFSRMSRVRPQSVEWAWEGMVPLGKLTLLTGNPGVGKSLTALQIAAMVSRGVTNLEATRGSEAGTKPETSKTKGEPSSSRGVLIFSAADAAEDTVLPRLIAAGADASQVFIFKGQMVDEPPEELSAARTGAQVLQNVPVTTVRPFRLSRDLGELQWCLEELADEGIDVGLIVIDSIDRYLGAGEKKCDRIEVVAQLADLAARSGAAVLVTANTSMKAGSRGGTVVYQELLNTARSILMVAEDPKNPERRLVLPVKHNLTARPSGASFTVEQGIVRWDTDPVTAAEAGELSHGRSNPRCSLVAEETHELDRATKWLEGALQDGPVSAEMIERQATSVDISYGTLRRAGKVLEIKVRKQNQQWFWSLPEQPAPAPVQKEEPVAGSALADDDMDSFFLESLELRAQRGVTAGTTDRVLV